MTKMLHEEWKKYKNQELLKIASFITETDNLNKESSISGSGIPASITHTISFRFESRLKINENF